MRSLALSAGATEGVTRPHPSFPILRIHVAAPANLSYVEQQRYDQRGFLEERTIENIETSGQISSLRWEYAPDALGRLGQQLAPDGDVTIFEYDHQGRVHSMTSNLHTESLRYDANANLHSREVGGQLVEERFYDGHDRLERLEQPQIGITRYGYTGNGHALTMSVEDAIGLALRTQTPHSIAGESLGRITPSGVSTSVALDEQRRAQSVGPGERRRVYEYDDSRRLTEVTEQDGSQWTFTGFNTQNLPTLIVMPGGGSITAGYDLLGRRTSQTVSFGEFTFAETFGYDALGRLRSAANTTDGTSIAFRYTLPGFLDLTTLTAAGQTLTWTQHAYPSGARLSLQYPSAGAGFATTIADVRTPAGQLQSSTIDGAPFITHVSYEMAGAPGQMILGPVTRNDRYDDRRRLISRTYLVGGEVRAELRYDFDGANREIARQAMHIGGRTDLFSFDADSRLRRAELEARPPLEEDGTAPWAALSEDGNTWRAGLYGRSFGYSGPDASAGQPDTIEQTQTNQWQNELVPTVVAQLAPPDDLGHPTLVDGAARAHDALGNTSTMQLEDGPATLVHDGLNRLRRVVRANGIVVRYGYRADGMRVSRQIECPTPPAVGIACEPRTELLVYHGLQLLEVRELAPVPRVRARYFYSDESDVPVAGDFLDHQTGTLERHYLLTDRQGSVIGVLDDQGTWVERVRYDPWGQPTFETADGQPPALSEVTVLGSGTVQVVFTETVLPPPVEVQSTPQPDVLPNLRPVSEVVRLVDPSASDRVISGTWRYAEGAGTVRGSVLTFEPSEALTAGQTYSLVVEAGGLLDRWSNPVVSITQSIVWGTGALYSGPASTPAVAPAATSLVGNEVLFQSHHYESVLGLYHMRARVFDPRTGMFLELDPSGYRDAANLYAGFANDHINNRDPTGALVDVTRLGRRARANLIRELSWITGRRVVVQRYARGKLKIAYAQGSQQNGGSEHAHRILNSAIEDPLVVRVEAGVVAGSLAESIPEGPQGEKQDSFERLSGAGAIRINFAGLDRLRGPARAVKAHGLGFTFFHELVHRFGFADPKDFGEQQRRAGDVEDEVNRIRTELNLPIRAQYGSQAGFSLGRGTELYCFIRYKDGVDAFSAIFDFFEVPSEIEYDVEFPCAE